MPKGIFNSSFRKYNKQIIRLSKGISEEIESGKYKSWTKNELVDRYRLSLDRFPYIIGKARSWIRKNYGKDFYYLDNSKTYKILNYDEEKRDVVNKKLKLMGTNINIVIQIDGTTGFRLIGSTSLINAQQKVNLLEEKLTTNENEYNTSTNRKNQTESV